MRNRFLICLGKASPGQSRDLAIYFQKFIGLPFLNTEILDQKKESAKHPERAL